MLKRSCFSAETEELNSFRLVIRGDDPTSNILSNSAGPSELGNCSNKRAPVEEQPSLGKIYYNANRVLGIEFIYVSTEKTLLIGSSKGESLVQAEFNETSSFIGFYGS